MDRGKRGFLPPRRKHHLYLSSDQRLELSEFIQREDTTPTRSDRAKILLLVDEGHEGPGLSNKEASEKIGTMGGNAIGELIRRANQMGPLKAAIGLTGEATKKRARESERFGRPPTLSRETDQEIAAAYATGLYSERELARKHGISRGALRSAIKRAEREI